MSISNIQDSNSKWANLEVNSIFFSTNGGTPSQLNYYEKLAPITLTFKDGTDTITGTTFTLKISRIGNVVSGQIICNGLFNDPALSRTNAITTDVIIPSNFRPSELIQLSVITQVSGTNYNSQIYILTDGRISVFTNLFGLTTWAVSGNNFSTTCFSYTV